MPARWQGAGARLATRLLARLCPARALPWLAGAERGLAGERVAARHLRRAGLRPIARRLRTPQGELDLVCRSADTLVVVEVKTGGYGPRFRPASRVRRRDLARRREAARRLAARAGLARWRVDLVEVLVPSAPGPVSSAAPAVARKPRKASRAAVTVLHHRDAGQFALGGRAPWEDPLP